MEEMVIFTKTLQMLQWLLPQCEKFPKTQRFVLTKRVQDAALDFQEALFLANAHTGRARLDHLQTADANLNKLRLYLRLVHEWGWLPSGPYAHASGQVAEIGRLLGGWLRQSRG